MSARSEAWPLFDAIVNGAPDRDRNPWAKTDPDGPPAFGADYETLTRLLAVPVALDANSQSGVPALALDVWGAYEFRRAGFDPDVVWPRPSAPRVLPAEIATLLQGLPRDVRDRLTHRIQTGGLKGLAGASATVLGKNYVKQVDVGMSSWRTGPELLISTKRMDSSFAKNAANRVEESYGDAKNLRLRHPRAALGFLYGLRSTALVEEPDKTDWLCDLLIKLGREEDAYDAVALIIPEWGDKNPGNAVAATGDESLDSDDALIAAELVAPPAHEDDGSDLSGLLNLDTLPKVSLRRDAVPPELSPDRFFATLIRKILENSPINFHQAARARLTGASH